MENMIQGFNNCLFPILSGAFKNPRMSISTREKLHLENGPYNSKEDEETQK